MANKILDKYNSAKRSLETMAHNLETSGNRGAAQAIRNALGNFRDLKGSLDNCKKYYQGNNGVKLMAEARTASETVLGYIERVQRLEHNQQQLGQREPINLTSAKIDLGHVYHALDLYKSKGMTVQHDYFEHD